MTEESSPDVAEAALEAGGDGYVVKSDAGRELLAAVRAVSGGKQYISAKLVGLVFVGPSDLSERRTFHELQIYSNDASLVDGFASLAARGLNTGNAVLVLATDARRQKAWIRNYRRKASTWARLRKAVRTFPWMSAKYFHRS